MLSHMTQESAYPCPVCHTLTTLEHPCPGCGRAPDPNAAAVITLDAEILRMREQVQEAKQRFEELTWQLAETRRQREAYATAVRAAVAAEKSATMPTVPLAPEPAPERQHPVRQAEASTGTVQNLLFILGGLLLGIAAIVFTAVAWTTFGVTGRAVILALFTLVTLAIPPLANLRSLRGTAETFAALGLLLLILDGYAAWFVNLGGIKDSWDGSFYAGTVCTVTALVGYGYGRWLGLTGPRFIALAVAQPVLPLYFAGSAASAEVWALVYAAVALADAVLLWRRPRLALAVVAWLFHGTALLIAVVMATFASAAQGNVMSSVALMAAALVFAAGAWIGGNYAHRLVAGVALALVLAAAIIRPLLPHLPNERRLLAAAAVVALVALLAWAVSLRTPPAPVVQSETAPVEERIPALWSTFDPAAAPPPPPAQLEAPADPWSLGARLGAAFAVFVPAIIAAGWAVLLGVRSVHDALPWWHAIAETRTYAWELPVAIVLIAGAAALLTHGYARELIAVAGAVSVALVLPEPSIVDLMVATGLLVWALTARGHRVVRAVAAMLLCGHALLAGQGSPMRAMLVMTAIAALGLAVATAASRQRERAIGGVAAGLVDLLLPWLAFTAVAAFGGGPVASWRMLLLVVLLVPVLGSGLPYRGYHVVAGLLIALYPLWPDLPGGESRSIYAAGAAIAATIVVFRCAWTWARWAAAVPLVAVLAWAGEDLKRVLWDSMTPHVELNNAIAVTLILIPVVGLTWRLGRRTALTIGGFTLVLPVLMWLAIMRAPWPALPAVTLLFGLSTIVTAVLRRMSPVFVGSLLTLSGLYAAWQEDWTRIAALSLIVVAMAIVAVAGPSLAARVSGWLVGAVAKVTLAYAIGDVADLRPEVTAYLVLIVAGLLLGLAFTPIVREARVAVEAAAHGSALVALALCQGSARAAAGVLALWGVAIGLTALRSGPVLRASVAGLAEAVAWYLVLRSYDVGTLEAYTLPIALVGVVLGVVYARGRSSWVAYGPALAAALLPSLGAVLLTSGGEWRRLLLGAGALATVVAGAVWRKQAPFVLGGGTLVILAGHELVLVWKLLPTWIPLAISGLLLVGLAITYERRRRDLARLRDAVSKMH